MAKISKENESLIPCALLKELLRYEYETGLFYWIKSGKGRKFGQPAGCVDNVVGYVRIGINGHLYLAHRLAWLYVYGDYPNEEQPYIDHIDGNPSDNRIENLKVSSLAENQKNRQMQSNNTSGVTGVRRYEKVKPSGKIYSYWIANWRDENGKWREKSFPIHKLGEEEAKQMAIECRTEQIRLLELNHNIIYSERHGN